MNITPLTGELHEALDDLVDLWHDDPRGRSLRESLGMTGEQFAAFVEGRDIPGEYAAPAATPPPLDQPSPRS